MDNIIIAIVITQYKLQSADLAPTQTSISCSSHVGPEGSIDDIGSDDEDDEDDSANPPCQKQADEKHDVE